MMFISKKWCFCFQKSHPDGFYLVNAGSLTSRIFVEWSFRLLVMLKDYYFLSLIVMQVNLEFKLQGDDKILKKKQEMRLDTSKNSLKDLFATTVCEFLILDFCYLHILPSLPTATRTQALKYVHLQLNSLERISFPSAIWKTEFFYSFFLSSLIKSLLLNLRNNCSRGQRGTERDK